MASASYAAHAAYAFDYRAPPVSPHYPSPPRFSTYSGQPSPRGFAKASGHTRRASHAPPGFGQIPRHVYEHYAYAQAQAHAQAQAQAQAQAAQAHAHAQQQAESPPRADRRQTTYVPNPRNPEHVSAFDYERGHPRPFRAPSYSTYPTPKSAHRDKVDPRRRASQWHHVFVDDDDYDQHRDAPPPYHTTYEFYDACGGGADHPNRDQASFYEQAANVKANTAKARRASQGTKPSPQPQKKSPKPEKTACKATAEDAVRAGIPAGFSYKNWDPSEEPITLLGSVFDSNSLGKWVYDWTVFYHGPATPMSDMAGDLWLLLIQLAGKIKRADEIIERIRQDENRELVEDFLDSGERLWIRLKKLLKLCEEYMWKAAKDENGGKKPTNMGKNSGCEFVDAIFGRDRELDKTEKLMSAIRLWSMRFDANCDEILRNPTI